MSLAVCPHYWMDSRGWPLLPERCPRPNPGSCAEVLGHSKRKELRLQTIGLEIGGYPGLSGHPA